MSRSGVPHSYDGFEEDGPEIPELDSPLCVGTLDSIKTKLRWGDEYGLITSCVPIAELHADKYVQLLVLATAEDKSSRLEVTCTRVGKKKKYLLDGGMASSFLEGRGFRMKHTELFSFTGEGKYIATESTIALQRGLGTPGMTIAVYTNRHRDSFVENHAKKAAELSQFFDFQQGVDITFPHLRQTEYVDMRSFPFVPLSSFDQEDMDYVFPESPTILTFGKGSLQQEVLVSGVRFIDSAYLSVRYQGTRILLDVPLPTHFDFRNDTPKEYFERIADGRQPVVFAPEVVALDRGLLN